MSTPVFESDMNFEAHEQSEADKRLVVMFYEDAIKNELKSFEEGRPIFDSVTLVKIITPGSRDTFVGDATLEYQQRFPRQWAQFKAKQEQTTSGTPLNQLPWITVAQVAEFNAMNVHTVEQLVGMPDAVSQRFMGHHAIKQKAQAYLDAAKDAAPMLKLQGELQKRDEQIAEMQAQIQALVKKASEVKQAD